MRIKTITDINLKKLAKRRGKALFLIAPISILFALSVIISSQASNLKTAADTSVFGTVEQQSKLITLTRGTAAFQQDSGAGRGSFSFDNSIFYESDLDVIESIDGVNSAEINREVPVINAITSDLIEDTDIEISQLYTLNSDTSVLYTSDSFEYVEDESVPILINASALQETYEDWGGKDEITVEIARGQRQTGGDAENIQDSFPIKTRAISYVKDDLVGKEFTISFGGLDEVSTFDNTFSQNGITFTKLDDDEVESLENEMILAISEFWDYEQLNTKQTYSFKVVGVIEDSSSNVSYIPEDFASVVMSDMIDNQIEAKVADIDLDLLNQQFVGYTFDGTEFSSEAQSVGGSEIQIGRPQGLRGVEVLEQVTSYVIPGLVVGVDREETGGSGFNNFGQTADATEYITDTEVYDKSVVSGERISVVLTDIYSRSTVVEALNDAGYTYTDLNNLDVFDTLEENLSVITTGLSVTFIAISAIIIVFTMGKFVSESKKEIGIFRAIGVTKNGIKILFVSQAILYVLVAYLIGLVTGLFGVFVTSGMMNSWFDSLIGNTIEETYNVVLPVGVDIFTSVSTPSIALYSLLLLLITVVVSFIPASRASQISPVEAIRGE